VIFINKKLSAMTPPRQTVQNFFHASPHMKSFGIHGLGSGVCQKAYRLQNSIEHRRLGFYCLILITRGAGWFESAHTSGRCPLRVSDAFFIFPGETHGYGVVASHDFEEHWIAFQGPAICQAEQTGLFQRANPLRLQTSRRISQLMREAFAVGCAPDPAVQRRLPALIHQILIDLQPTLPSGSSHPVDQDSLEQIRLHLSATARESVDLQAIARAHGMSYSSMRTQFRNRFGIAPGRYHLTQKLNLACTLLSGGIRVKEAAAAVGIPDPYYFSRLLKQFTGMAPSDISGRCRPMPKMTNPPSH